MYPYLLEWMPSYPVALVAAVAGSALVGVLSLRRITLPLAACLRLQAALLCAGLLGGKIHSLIERGGAALPLVQEITQGYRYPGALIVLVLTLLVAGRRLMDGVSLGAIGDAIAPSIGVGAALLRIGCFLYGCCFGSLASVPWAMRFPAHSPPWHAHVAAAWIGPASGQSLPVHPTQLYFAVLSLTAAALAWRLQLHRRFDGQAILTFLAIDGLGKALLETWRADAPPGVQYASFAIGLSAALVLLLRAVIGGRPRSQRKVRRRRGKGFGLRNLASASPFVWRTPERREGTPAPAYSALAIL